MHRISRLIALLVMASSLFSTFGFSSVRALAATSTTLGLKITLPTHDLVAGSVHQTSSGFTLTLTNNLTAFYSIDPPPSPASSSAMLWSRGLLGPKQKVTLTVALTTSEQGVLLQLNPTTVRAVTLDELVIAIDLVEVYLGIDVDPVAVLNASPDLISVGVELLGASDYSAPLGALQKALSANSMQDRTQAIMGLSTSLAAVMAKPVLLKRLAPLLAAGLRGAGGKSVTQASVKQAMTGLVPVLTGLSRLIVGGRIGAMFLDFSKLIAERITSPDNNAFAPLIPVRLIAVPLKMSHPADTHAIKSVSFSGGADSPLIIIHGAGFGRTPPPEVVPPSCEAGGFDYSSGTTSIALGIEDDSGRPPWTAGGPGNCVGLENVAYSSTQVSFAFANNYFDERYLYSLNQGDSFQVFVNGLVCKGLVDYTRPVVCQAGA